MKLKLIAACLFIAAALAQTALAPTPIDWRYSFFWDDLNPPGAVANWTVYASNNVAVRISQTRTTSLPLQPLLNGAPAGTYALFVSAFSNLGDVSDPSTNLFVSWPGGNGRIKGGGNPRVNR